MYASRDFFQLQTAPFASWSAAIIFETRIFLSAPGHNEEARGTVGGRDNGGRYEEINPPRHTATPVAPRRRATLVTHLIFRFHGDRLVQRTPADGDRRGWRWWWLRTFSLIMRVAPPGRKGWNVALSLSLFPLYVSLSGWTLSERTFNDISVSRKQEPLKTNILMRDT